MNMFISADSFNPLLHKYKGKAHPLEFKNLYQLVVVVVLSAQDSDKHINEIAPTFFKAFPTLASIAKADAEDLFPYINDVRNFGNKTKWLLELASIAKEDATIPTTLDELIKLPGIGRKSANVILRGIGAEAEGIIVDLHVIRVAPRIGIAIGADPKKIEKQLMDLFPKKDWGEIGMAISFLGRETCRPSNPKCGECVINDSCAYFKSKE